jgi:anti-sigma factor RsiW
MSCSQFDLKAYFLGEPGAAGRGAVEEHLKACTACREELDRLRLTGAALASVPDEEMPHRIAFVSDKIFEPRGWARFWNSAPRLGFASAAMLSAAIILHGFISTVEMRRTAEMVAASERRIQAQRQQDLTAMEESVTWLQKRMNTYYVSSASFGGRP